MMVQFCILLSSRKFACAEVQCMVKASVKGRSRVGVMNG